MGFKQEAAGANVLDHTKVGSTFVWFRLYICIIAFADLTKPNTTYFALVSGNSRC